MILVDMNQVTISNLMMQIGSKRQNDVDGDMVRHMVLNSLRMCRPRFFEEYGELVLVMTAKGIGEGSTLTTNRTERRIGKTLDFDWDLIFETLNAIRDEIRDTFIHKVLEVDGAEADDCIATVMQHISVTPTAYEKVLILSGDKDFIQLQKHNFVKQYSTSSRRSL